MPIDIQISRLLIARPLLTLVVMAPAIIKQALALNVGQVYCFAPACTAMAPKQRPAHQLKAHSDQLQICCNQQLSLSVAIKIEKFQLFAATKLSAIVAATCDQCEPGLRAMSGLLIVYGNARCPAHQTEVYLANEDSESSQPQMMSFAVFLKKSFFASASIMFNAALKPIRLLSVDKWQQPFIRRF